MISFKREYIPDGFFSVLENPYNVCDAFSLGSTRLCADTARITLPLSVVLALVCSLPTSSAGVRGSIQVVIIGIVVPEIDIFVSSMGNSNVSVETTGRS